MYSKVRYLITIPRNLFCRPPEPGIAGVSFVLTAEGLRTARQTIGDDLTVCMGSPMQTDQKSYSRCLQNRFSRYLRWVAPFGDPWIKAYSQLPTAFRSVSRPSSPVHAKASTKCP